MAEATPYVYFKPYPSRPVASGTVTLAALGSQAFSGLNARQDRRQIVVTNLDSALLLKVRTSGGAVLATVFPQTAWTIETNADLEVYNPDVSSTVDFEVCEWFYDGGTASGPGASASPAAAQAAAASAAAGVSSPTGGAVSSGSTGGTYTYGGTRGSHRG